jgi:hypothetical protein
MTRAALTVAAPALVEHRCARRPPAAASMAVEHTPDGWALCCGPITASIRFCPFCGLVLVHR